MANQDHKTGLPESLLDQIFEHTNNGNNGGFMLAYVSEKGDVNVISKASAPIIELGIIKGVEAWLDNMSIEHQINSQNPED